MLFRNVLSQVFIVKCYSKSFLRIINQKYNVVPLISTLFIGRLSLSLNSFQTIAFSKSHLYANVIHTSVTLVTVCADHELI